MLHACLNLVFSKTRYSPSRKRRRRWRFTKNIENKTTRTKKEENGEEVFPRWMGKDLSGGDDPGTGTPFRVHRINSGKGQSHSRCKYKKVKNMMLLEPDGLYIHSAWWAKGEFTPENLSHWRFVRRMIIPSRFRLMGEGRFYSRECVSKKFCKRDDYS